LPRQAARSNYKAMSIAPINIAIFVAMGLVLAALVAGIVNLSMTSDKARSRSNQLMRLRVLAQFLAIVLLMVGFWLKTRQN
jgi:FtsH-binding integral membrane protein